jgi:tetratricopeptide (TPR) repeat protein
MRSNVSNNRWVKLLQITTLGLALQQAMPALGSTMQAEEQAREYYHSGDKERSLELFEAIYKEQPNIRNQQNLAYFHREFQSFTRAEELLLDLVRKQPLNVDVLLGLGALYIVRHESEKGIEFLRQAVKRAPLNDYAVERLASAYFGAGQIEPARATLNDYSSKTNSFPRTHRVLMALIAERMGNYAEAISLYEALLEQADSGISDQLLVAGAIGLVDQAKAQALFEQILAENSEQADVWASYAEFLQRIGDSSRASEAYQKAAELLSKDDSASMSDHDLLRAGDYYARAENPQAAREILKIGLDRLPWDSRFHTKLGWVSLGMDDLSVAETHFKSAYAAVPADPYHSLALAELYQQRNMQAEYLQFEADAAQTMSATNPELARLLDDSVYQHGLRVAPSIGVAALAGFYSSGQTTDSLLRGFALTGSREPLFIKEQTVGAKIFIAEQFGWQLQLGHQYIDRSGGRDESDNLSDITLSRVLPQFLGLGDLTVRPGFKYSYTDEAAGGRYRTFHQSGMQLDMNLYNSRWNWSLLARQGTDNPSYTDTDTRFSEVKFSIGQTSTERTSFFFSAGQQNNELDNGVRFKTRTVEAGMQNNFANGLRTGLLFRQVTDSGMNFPFAGVPKSYSLTLSINKEFSNQFTSRLEYEMAGGRGLSDFDRNRTKVEFIRPIRFNSFASLRSGKVAVNVPANIRFGIEHLDYSNQLDGDRSYAFLQLEIPIQ